VLFPVVVASAPRECARISRTRRTPNRDTGKRGNRSAPTHGLLAQLRARPKASRRGAGTNRATHELLAVWPGTRTQSAVGQPRAKAQCLGRAVAQVEPVAHRDRASAPPRASHLRGADRPPSPRNIPRAVRASCTVLAVSAANWRFRELLQFRVYSADAAPFAAGNGVRPCRLLRPQQSGRRWLHA
jgi:hypothetical protein